MQKFNYEKVESAIGYHFNNGKLLKQAFFRSSFAHDNGCESNEVLEFIGDKVLDLAVIRILLEKFSKPNKGKEYFISTKKEGELTKTKAELVSTGYLAGSFDVLRLDEFICYGKSDLNNKTSDVLSIKEDVFEAIIGAIALDSNFNMDQIIMIVKKLLHTDRFLNQSQTDTNFVGLLQEEIDRLGIKPPQYALELRNDNGVMQWHAVVHVYGIEGVKRGVGLKQKDAKRDAAEKMLQFLRTHKNEILQKLTGPKQKDEPFAIINHLVQSGEISKPIYQYSQNYDDNGNPIWECEVDIEELDYIYIGRGSTKKEAQKNSLLRALNALK